MWRTGLVAPRHVRSSQTRARTRVPCIGRQILFFFLFVVLFFVFVFQQLYYDVLIMIFFVFILLGVCSVS